MHTFAPTSALLMRLFRGDRDMPMPASPVTNPPRVAMCSGVSLMLARVKIS
jgi:hypothetical protein